MNVRFAIKISNKRDICTDEQTQYVEQTRGLSKKEKSRFQVGNGCNRDVRNGELTMGKVEKQLILLLLFCALILAGCGETTAQTATGTQRTETIAASTPTPTPDTDYSTIKTHEVESSCFSRIGYDSDRQILKVCFRDSGVYYVYFDFPADEYRAFCASESLGRYFNAYIKGEYEYERLG